MNKKNLLLLTIICFAGSNILAQIPESGSKNNILNEYKSLSESLGPINKSIYTDPSRSPEERTLDLISRMTFDEKILLTGGWTEIKVKGSFNMPGLNALASAR